VAGVWGLQRVSGAGVACQLAAALVQTTPLMLTTHTVLCGAVLCCAAGIVYGLYLTLSTWLLFHVRAEGGGCAARAYEAW
jgi:hypothetical protein